MKAISLKDVWLKYRIEFKENGKISREDFWALKAIDIDVNKGETIGIMGENGAGKTTLLKVISGMLKPDRGIVQVKGKVSTVMEIGAGFQRDLTGRENVYLISSLFGFNKEQIDTRYNEIVKFASIGRFINAPVKSYSQGMYMRLAFAIAIHIDPDILMIDDMLAVGDIYAQRKCINKVFELREQGKTFILITQDIEMSKKLCTRGIFIREGKIIKDGPIDKVCNYYMETVGDKKGIALMQEGSLGVVFNNGKLILRWRDRAITCGLSGYSLMLSSGRQYLSKTADWEIQRAKIAKEIVAIGNWPDLPVTQYWKISFLNEKEFVWEITLHVSKEVAIEKIQTAMIFIDEYKSWFTLNTEANFPETFLHITEWECSMINGSSDRMIGLRSNRKIAEAPPTIIFDRLYDNTKMICQVGNTGSEVNGRVIVYEYPNENPNNNYILGAYRCFLGKARIFENEEEKELRYYLNQIKQLIRESTIVRRDSLSLFCKENNIEIYWQDKLLTSRIGLNTKFRCQNRDYSASDGHWNINKKNNEEIVITISWDDETPFIQIWTLKLQTNDIILWEVEMNIDEKIKLRNKQVELVLSEEYERWITTEERGNFERLEKKGCGVVLKKYINTHIGVESVDKSDDFLLPGVLCNCKDETPRVSYISKIKEERGGTKLRYLEIDSKENFYTLPGKCEYFRGEIRIITEHQEDNLIKKLDKRPSIINNVDLSNNRLQVNRLSLVFNYGKGRLFWKDTELTKGLGMYSSVFFKGIWYDSSQAFWEIRRLDKEKLVAVGHWSWVPLMQTWEIAILDENTISWKIAKEIWEDVLLDREQVNIMVSDEYKEWFVRKQSGGSFPGTFSEHNGIFWDRLWCGDRVLSIGIKKCRIKKGIFERQFLPSVVFSCSEHCQARHSIIENTDSLFRGRILQYELDSSRKETSFKNKDKYFEGQIKIVT